MKKYIPISICLLLSMICLSCNGGKHSETPKESTSLSEAPVQEKKVVQDPYFRPADWVSAFHGPENISRNVMQDKQGLMWFATWEGIISYNGLNFSNHTNKEGLKPYRAFSLLEDRSGRLWFGTIGTGVYMYDPQQPEQGKGGFVNYTKEDGLVNNDVGCIYEDAKGNLWFGTRVGLSRYDGKTFKNFTEEDGLTDNDINSIAEDKNGTFWIAARGFACTWDGSTFTKIVNDKGESFSNARSIIKDHKGNIWLGGQDGLWAFDGTSFRKHLSEFVGYIFQDREDNLWICRSEPNNIYNMALYKCEGTDLSAEASKFTRILSPQGQVFGITQDSEGNIWFGLERGVCRYNGVDFEYFRK